MKIRNGFVSNSSSSSFICEICGHTETGFDISHRDLGFVMCQNEHLFCEEHLINTNDGVEYDEYEDFCIVKHCPICQFEEYSQSELSRYLLKVYGVPKDVVFAEIKAVNKRRKKLYDYEYIEYVFKKHDLTDDKMLTMMKEEFGEYSKFYDFISKG